METTCHLTLFFSYICHNWGWINELNLAFRWKLLTKHCLLNELHDRELDSMPSVHSKGWGTQMQKANIIYEHANYTCCTDLTRSVFLLKRIHEVISLCNCKAVLFSKVPKKKKNSFNKSFFFVHMVLVNLM